MIQGAIECKNRTGKNMTNQADHESCAGRVATQFSRAEGNTSECEITSVQRTLRGLRGNSSRESREARQRPLSREIGGPAGEAA